MKILKDRVMQIAKIIYSNTNEELLEFWSNILDNFDDINEIKKHSISLAALYLLIESMNEEGIKDIPKVALINKANIIKLLQPYIDTDFKRNKDKSELIDEIISQEMAETGSSLLYHRIREAISMQLFEMEDNVPTFKFKERTTNKTHVAKLLPDVSEGMVLNNGEIGQWEVLMTQAITSMDDYTADTFDAISILWMSTAKTPQEMIKFSHEDVLRFRQLEKSKGGTGFESYQKPQRIEVMRRLAAIASIWISVDDDENIMFVEQMDKNKDFKMSRYRRLFHIDNVTFAHDRKTNEAIGIYEFDIRPTDLLAKYLYGSQKTTSFLSLKALQYNPVHQKFHKRLTRYLSWQWRMRSKKKDYEKPFNIGGDKGLLKSIGMEPNTRFPNRTKESFDRVLDKLEEDKVIKEWRYVDEDMDRYKEKGWLENYWMKLQVIIEVPDEIKWEFNANHSEAIDYNRIAEFGKTLHSANGDAMNEVAASAELIRKPHQLELLTDDSFIREPEVSPQTVKRERKLRGLSITKAAEEIGIAHTTLSRYEKGLIKKPNAKNDEKIKQWLMS